MPWPITETLFLIGFPGSGKSTVGALLAGQTDRAFVDLDAQIVGQARATLSEVFAREGEQSFRKREAEALRGAPVGAVVAVGGGAPCFGDNLDWMLAHGKVVCLRADEDEIVRRIGDPASRPLLANAEDLRAEVKRLLELRSEFYRRAHLTIETGAKSAMEVACAIGKAMAS